MLFNRTAVLQSREEQYGIYNFHREDDLAFVAEMLAADEDERPPVLILEGEAGCGRDYFLNAAAYRAELAGRRVRLGALDLSGFEAGGVQTLEEFATHQMAKRSSLERSRVLDLLKEVKPSLKASGPGLAGASLFSIAIGLDAPYERTGAALKRLFEATAGNAPEPIEALYDFFRPLTAVASSSTFRTASQSRARCCINFCSAPAGLRTWSWRSRKPSTTSPITR